MSFKKIDFLKEKEVLLDELSEEVKEKIKENNPYTDKFIDKIDKEIERLFAGTSKYRKIAFQRGSGIVCLEALTRLKADFTTNNVSEFLLLAGQDFGHNISKIFTIWLEGKDE